MAFTLRTVKQAPLSFEEVDENFQEVANFINGDTVNNLGTVSGNVSVNCSLGTYVAMTVSDITNISFEGIPDATRAYGITLEITNGGAKVTWPQNITWLSNIIPALQTTGISLVTLITRDGGNTWLGISQ